MGLSSFWAAIVGPRVKEITPHRPFSFEQQTEQNASVQQTLNYNLAGAARSEVAINQPSSTFQDKQTKRKSRTFTLPKQKSEGDLKKVKRRRSWFGGKPTVAEDVPAVPALPTFGPAVTGNGPFPSRNVPEDEIVRPGTALTTDEPISWSRPGTPEVEQKKARRLSLGNALKSRKRSQSSASTKKIERRQSVLGGFRDVAPPVPAVPLIPAPLNVPANAVSSPQKTSFDNRKSQRMSFGRPLMRERTKSSTSIRSSKSKRSSWWQSSNPDDGGSGSDLEYRAEELPPMPSVPPLIYDGAVTPDSSVANTSSPANSDYITSALFSDAPIRTVTRGNSLKAPRPVSGVSLTSKRRTYTPKSAANGFIKSTSQRASYRHSLLDDGENGMICLSDEQQREWDKLKNLMNVLEARQDNYASSTHSTARSTTASDDNGVMGMLRELENDEHRRDQAKHSNSQALAALEFHAS